MEKNPSKNPFSAEDLRRVIGSAEGKQLMALLSQDGGALQQAAAAFRGGDVAGAQELLKPLVSTPEAGRLLDELSRK